MTTPATPVKIDGMNMDEYLERTRERPLKIIDGEVIEMSPTILLHSLIVDNARALLDAQTKENHPGRVFVETTYVLPGSIRQSWVKGSRVPDVMFYAQARFSQDIKTNPDWRKYPIALIPDLVVEVLSPNDRYGEVMRDVNAYLQDGVKLILVLEPDRENVIVHSPDSLKPAILQGNDVLSLDAVLPGFSTNTKSLFVVPEEDEDESES